MSGVGTPKYALVLLGWKNSNLTGFVSDFLGKSILCSRLLRQGAKLKSTISTQLKMRTKEANRGSEVKEQTQLKRELAW